MLKHTKTLAALSLVLAVILTLAAPAAAYDGGWDTWTQTDGTIASDYTNMTGPAQMRVPDNAGWVLGIRNPNMTSISVPKDVKMNSSTYETIGKQCTEIIYRGTAQDLIASDEGRGFEIDVKMPRAITVKDESGNVLGWVGGEYANGPFGHTIIGGWRMLNMVQQPEADPDTAETVVIPDGVTGLASSSVDLLNKGISNPNMKRISLPKGFNTAVNNNGIEQCTEIIYRGTVEDLDETSLIFYDLKSDTSPVIPVKDEAGRIFGWVGGPFGDSIGSRRTFDVNKIDYVNRHDKVNILTNSLPLDKSVPVRDQSGNTVGYIPRIEGKTYPEYFTVNMPAGAVTILGGTVQTPTDTNFSDVKPTEWYAGAVNWAISKEITNGTGANTFGPKANCTNAHIITFLYRAAGSPSVGGATLPFTAKHDWAEDALKWACSKGIIGSGFDEDAPCTRYSAVDYIWKAFGSPAVQSGTNFNDIQGLDAKPVAWAVSKHIVEGTGPNTFSPNTVCNRATIVTLLHRAYSN